MKSFPDIAELASLRITRPEFQSNRFHQYLGRHLYCAYNDAGQMIVPIKTVVTLEEALPQELFCLFLTNDSHDVDYVLESCITRTTIPNGQSLPHSKS